MALNRREMEKQKVRRSNAKKVAEKQQSGFSVGWLKKLPNNIQMLRFKEEKVYKLDVVPFLAGKENPNADEGMEHFERTAYTHSGIGLDPRAHYLCPLMTSKEGKAKKLRPCPVCEHAQKLQLQGAAKDETDQYRPKRRQLFMFIDTKDREKGCQLAEGPYFFGLGQLIDNKMDALDEDSPKLQFWTYDEGMTLYINVKKTNFKGQSYMKPVDLEIEPRAKQYDASLMDKGCCLDDLVKELPYDELAEIFSQTGSADEDEPERNGKPKDDADDDDNEPAAKDDDETAEDKGIEIGCRVKHKKFGICEVTHVSKDGTSLKLEDADGDLHSAVAPSECQLFEKDADENDDGDDGEDEEPVAKPSKKPTRRVTVENDTDVELEECAKDDEDEKPAKPSKKPAARKPEPEPEDDEKEDADEDDPEDDDEPLEEEDSDTDWDEDEDEKPVKKPAAKPAAKPGKKPGKR